MMEKAMDRNSIQIVRDDNVAKYLPRIESVETNRDFRDEVAENSEDVFVIRYEDEIIGLTYIEDDPDGFLYVYIFPEYRRKGYGYLAACAAERRRKTQPPMSTMTALDPEDEGAKKLAGKLGYKEQYASAVMKYRGDLFENSALPIRKYREEDFYEAYTLAAEAFHQMRLETGRFPDSVVAQPNDEARKAWQDTADERYVYVLDGEIVGHGKISGDVLDSIAIKISHQGKGLGRAFVRFLVNRMMERGNQTPCLWCVVGNDKARRLYESVGFCETGRAVFAVKKEEERICD